MHGTARLPVLRLILLVFLLGSSVRSHAAKIAADGQARARIVVPASATATERFAARELQDYLLEICGAKLPIEPETSAGRGPRLWIGATSPGKEVRPALAARDPEAFLVRTLGEDLLLVGATDRATLYAVYDFLEQELGCRWLGPGPEWEVVPRQATIDVADVDRTESPAMKYRFLRMTVAAEPGTWLEGAMSWAVKQKINIGAGWPAAELPEAFAQRGGFRGWMGPHLLIPNVLQPEKYFNDHPEWYALLNGQRRMLANNRTQLCTSNPEVAAMIAEGVGRFFDARPEVDFVAMGQADGTAFCQCDRCTALDTGEVWSSYGREAPVITERWLSFVNAVARRLRATHPGKKVYTLAYHQTFRPPDPRRIRPEPNVMIQVVNSRPNYVCFVHRFENESCPHHVKFRKGLEDWVAMTPAGVMVYEYDPHSTFCAMPYPAPYKFVDDIKYLHRVGVVGYEGQSSPTLWGTYGINHYAIAKTTWDRSVDAESLVRDYCDHAFGEASGPMRRFLKTIEQGLVAADHITEGIWSYMTPDVMAEARRHLDEAHAAARSPSVKRRLCAFEIGFHYGELGSEAWRKAQQARAAKDARLLAEAIELAEAAARYCLDEQRKEPHYAASPGKLTSVYARSWKRQLESMK